MADVTQLKADLDSLKQAVTDDQAAVASVQSYVQAQASEITSLEDKLSSLSSQTGDVADLDLTDLESSIETLKAQNQALAAAVTPAGSMAATPANS